MDSLEDSYIIECPHCLGSIVIHKNDINCKIFRHAVYKKNFKHINPHTSKEECESLLKKDVIFGCGKPFKFDGKNIEVCDYI